MLLTGADSSCLKNNTAAQQSDGGELTRMGEGRDQGEDCARSGDADAKVKESRPVDGVSGKQDNDVHAVASPRQDCEAEYSRIGPVMAVVPQEIVEPKTPYVQSDPSREEDDDAGGDEWDAAFAAGGSNISGSSTRYSKRQRLQSALNLDRQATGRDQSRAKRRFVSLCMCRHV